MATASAESDVVIADFGMSRFLPKNEGVLKTSCGTPNYVGKWSGFIPTRWD